jgi:hypothetical protein
MSELKTVKPPNISQSLLKDFMDFFDQNEQSCGRQLYYRHFEKRQTEQSDVQRLGTYFEYIATGYKHKDDPIPMPDIVYKGTARESMAQPYKNAHQSAELFKQIIKAHKIEIVKTGEYMFYEGSSGISDIRAIWNGKPCIIDTKYTALLEDKFNPYGWHTESLIYKPKLLIQPIHYKYLIHKIEGIENIDFYYFLFSSNKPELAKIIKTNIQQEHIDLHENTFVEKMKNYTAFYFNNPEKLEARPKFIRCKECPYNDICSEKVDVPQIEEIDY